MIIRSNQMSVFQEVAEEDFIHRFCRHLIEQYAETEVHLPDKKTAAVGQLPREILYSLIENGIERARNHGLSLESSIAAFNAIRFEFAPNFDTHELSRPVLKDEAVEPDSRVDLLLEKLSEENWQAIRNEYDADAW